MRDTNLGRRGFLGGASALTAAGWVGTIAGGLVLRPTWAHAAGPIKMGRVFVQLYRPRSFQEIATRLLAAEPLLSARWNTPLTGVLLEGNRIASLNGMQVGVVIDCTGTAEVGRAADEELLATDDTTQAPSVVFPLENVERDLSTPVAVAQVLLALAHAGLPPVSFMPCAETGVVAVKFAGQPGEAPRLLEFLQRKVAGFEHCRTSQTEFTIARRAGTMIVLGEYLTICSVTDCMIL